MLFGYIDPEMLAGPGVTSWARSPEGLRSERYEKEDALGASTVATGGDSLDGGLAPADPGAAGDEAAFGDVSELRWSTTSTTAAAAATLPIVVKTRVRRRRTG